MASVFEEVFGPTPKKVRIKLSALLLSRIAAGETVTFQAEHITVELKK
jgi:hypothetical protein